MTVPSDLLPALSSLPLFPLGGVTLFPGARTPLHIFEPRYRTMIREVIDSHKTLAIVQLREGTANVEGAPEIARIAGVGSIIDYAELPSGRFNILVRGRARVELEELPFVPPYRRAQAKLIEEPSESVRSTDLAAMVSSAGAFAELVRSREKSFEFRLHADADAGKVADQCASELLIDGRDRQRVLETIKIVDRVRLVTELLSVQRFALASADGQSN